MDTVDTYKTRRTAAETAMHDLECAEIRTRSDKAYVRGRLAVVHEHIMTERRYASTRRPEIALVIESGLQALGKRAAAVWRACA